MSRISYLLHTARFSLYFVSLCLLNGTAYGVMVDRTLAIVNSEAILHSDINRFRHVYPLRKELDPLVALVSPNVTATSSDEEVLSYLVQERLISQIFKASEQDIETKIVEVMRGNSLSKSALEDFLRSRGFNYDDYYDLMRVGLEKQQLLNREIRERVNISEDDIRNHYYNSSKHAPDDSIEYAIQLIYINESNYKSTKNAADIAKTALAAVRSGEPFQDVARRSSDDASAKQGGEIGFIAANQLNPTLLKAVKALKIGTTSELLEVSGGFYIVRLIDIRSQHNEQIESAKNEIREQLARTEYSRQITLWTERAKQNAYVRINK